MRKKGMLRGEPYTADDRFFAKIRETLPPYGDCWMWTAPLRPDGYGQFWGGDATQGPQLAHRWAFERFKYPIPLGLDIDHLCGHPACVNPVHLEPVTPMENKRRRRKPRRRSSRLPNTSPRGSTIEQRFLDKVEQRQSECGICWFWIPNVSGDGYGSFHFDGKTGYAHRFAYQHWKGPIPIGHQVDHLCKNRGCVNPEHLEAVPGSENLRRAALRKSHCKHGHERTKENTYVRKDGGRSCIICQKTASARHQRTRKR